MSCACEAIVLLEVMHIKAEQKSNQNSGSVRKREEANLYEILLSKLIPLLISLSLQTELELTVLHFACELRQQQLHHSLRSPRESVQLLVLEGFLDSHKAMADVM